MPPFVVGGVGRIDERLKWRHGLPVRPWGSPAGTRIDSVFYGGSPVAKEEQMPGLPHLVHTADLRNMDILPWFHFVFESQLPTLCRSGVFFEKEVKRFSGVINREDYCNHSSLLQTFTINGFYTIQLQHFCQSRRTALKQICFSHSWL